MTQRDPRTLEERARQAILQYAFFRPESAGIIALTLILTTLSFAFRDSGVDAGTIQSVLGAIPWFGWLIGGALAEALVVYSSLTDTEAHRRVVAQMLQDEFEPERLQDSWLQQQVQSALDYRKRITEAIRERRDSVLKDHLADTATQLDDWIEEVYGLAQRLDRYERERELHGQNRDRAERRLQQLHEQLKREQNPAVRQEIELNISSLERQLNAIEQLRDSMERARLRLENTLTSMGTIYTQTMLVGAKDIDSGRARRLRQEIAEEVTDLSDVLQAMDEVYAGENRVQI